MTRRRLWVFALFLVLVVPAHGQAASSAANAGERREKAIRLPDILDALAISNGSRVADIGAGAGFFTARLARKVGAEGRIFSIDIDEQYAIPKLKELVQKEALENVAVIQSVPADPKLSTASIDAVLMVNVYHEVEPYREMLSHVLDALKPGGRFVIVDNMPHKTKSRPRADQTKNHVLSPDLAETEFKATGFEIVSRKNDFIDRPDEEDAKWMIICRRPN